MITMVLSPRRGVTSEEVSKTTTIQCQHPTYTTVIAGTPLYMVSVRIICLGRMKLRLRLTKTWLKSTIF